MEALLKQKEELIMAKETASYSDYTSIYIPKIKKLNSKISRMKYYLKNKNKILSNNKIHQKEVEKKDNMTRYKKYEQYQIEYKLKHKKRELARRKHNVECPNCGRSVRKYGLREHMKTKRCLLISNN